MSYKNKTSTRVLLPFGLDYSDVLTQGQAVEGPTLELPVHGALSPLEESTAKQTLALTKLLYDGPFFTGSAQEKEQSNAPGDSIERYSDRYIKVRKVGRSIDEYPYQLEFFPEELYSVMGITKKKKKLLLSSYKEDGGLAQFDVKPDADADAQSMLEKLKNLADDLDVDPAAQANEEEVEEEDFDDQFEEDDDDDYNAEKYFDDGDDDMPDDGDDEAAF